MVPKSALVLSPVIGGLYALKGTSVVKTAIKVGERHDANVCILCEDRDHTAAKCEEESDLPLVREKAKADARAEEAEKRKADAERKAADAERKAAEKEQEAADARAALVASRSVGQTAAGAAEAALAPATHCRGVRMTAGGKIKKCVERHALTRD